MARRRAPSTPRRSVPTAMGIAAVLVAVGVVALVVALSGGSGSGSSPSPDASPVTVTGAGPARVGAAPPSFHGTGVDGRTVDLGSLRGRVVVVNFFATWCTNCRAELPLLERTAAQEQGRGLSVVAVQWNDTGDGAAFLRQYGVTFPALLDPDSRVGDAYGINDLPVSVFVGRDGRVADVFHGQLSDATLGPELARLLG